MNEIKPCKLCGEETPNVFNINFEATPICEWCAQRIFIQQANWYVTDYAIQKARKRVKDKGNADK